MPAKFINIAFQIEFSDEISFGFVMKPNEIHKVFCAASSFASDSLLSGLGLSCSCWAHNAYNNVQSCLASRKPVITIFKINNELNYWRFDNGWWFCHCTMYMGRMNGFGSIWEIIIRKITEDEEWENWM